MKTKLLGLLVLLLVACNPFDSTPVKKRKPFTIANLSANTWVLATYTLNGVVDSLPDSTLSVRFADSGVVSMKSCNWTFGNYTMTSDTIRFGPMSRTGMVCMSPTLSRGDDWSDSLLSEPLVGRFSGNDLTLRRANVVFLFKDSASAN